MVKLYCPKCMDVYTPKSSRHHHTDGAYFGTGFPHMLFMVHPEYRPKRPANQFVPRWVESGPVRPTWGQECHQRDFITFTSRAFSRRIYPKFPTISTFVRRKRNDNISLSVQ